MLEQPIRIQSTAEARILVVLTPPGFEGYWEATSRLRSKSRGPPDPASVLALQRRHRMEAAGRRAGSPGKAEQARMAR